MFYYFVQYDHRGPLYRLFCSDLHAAFEYEANDNNNHETIFPQDGNQLEGELNVA